MKSHLTETEKATILPAVLTVLSTKKSWENRDLHYPVDKLVATLVDNIPGLETCSDFDTNGWQWDWWQHFTYNGEKFTLSGSGYSGGLSFYLAE
jgi:hypothetical protein